MKMRAFLLSALIAVPAGSLLSGGWAVVTIENPPEYLTVGVPYTLEYSVRQHGIERHDGLKGYVEARNGLRSVRADASDALTKGKYRAIMTIPSDGKWTITVESGFGPSKTKMKPITVAAWGTSVAPMSLAERGDHLFVAKGCATCHVEMKVLPVDIRSNKYDEKFVKQLLANPSAMPKRYNVGLEMPNLGLKDEEISALAAYLSAGPNSTGTR
jgi:hypothetical protein